jgi:pyridoxine kinase
MLVISIQSQVCWGHVGNSAAVFPMQAAGLDVIAVPTTLLSNHPRYPTMRGRVLEADLVADLLRGVEERGAAARAEWIVTGYMGSAANAEAAADFVARVKAANPRVVYLCDPVMGDSDTGFFTPPAVQAAIAGRLAPLADVLTPNQFELGALARAAVGSVDSCLAAARGLGAGLVVTTGAVFDEPETIWTLAATPADAWAVRAPRVDRRPGGAGDLFAALFVAARANGHPAPDAMARAASGVHAALRRTPEGAWPEMPIVAAAAEMLDPAPLFPAISVPSESIQPAG